MLKTPDRGDDDRGLSDDAAMKVFHGCLGVLVALFFMTGVFTLVGILLWKLL